MKKQLPLEKLIDKLQIEAGKKHIALYNIHYCRAGWGLQMHYDDKYVHHYEFHELIKDKNGKPIVIVREINQKDGMETQSYHRSLRKAVWSTIFHVRKYKVNEEMLKTIRKKF